MTGQRLAYKVVLPKRQLDPAEIDHVILGCDSRTHAMSQRRRGSLPMLLVLTSSYS